MMSGVFSTTTKPRDERISHHELGGGVTDFVSIDGEGMRVFVCHSDGTIDDVHSYVLLGVGSDQLAANNIADGLQFTDILEFVYAHYKKGVAFTGFYLGYDFTQWFKTLPRNRAFMLLTKEGIARRTHRRKGIPPHPVEWCGWQFDLLANKRLRIRPKTCDCPFPSCKCAHAPWMYVCDAGGFFQTSFINVINPKKWPEPIVTEDEYETILAGKSNRSAAHLGPEMRYYNQLENEVFSRVMREVDKGLKATDVYLPSAKWFGPGQAAQAWLKNRAPTGERVREEIPGWFLEAARASYFGGWFEIMAHGMVKGTTHEYDINSAYPYVIANLPCLFHGTYSRGTGKPTVSGSELCLVRARVWSQSYGERRGKRYIGAMLHRDAQGRITRPLITEGWYWLHEIDAAKRAGLITRISDDRYYEWVKYHPCDCPPPLREVYDLYSRRLEVGKDSPLGKGCKLIYNSDYGKFAQSVGNPMFGNAVYASLITSGCRTQITQAIATHPKGKSDVAMVATDAVYFFHEHKGLRIGSGLGEWSHTIRNDLTLFKPGVYWDAGARQQVARGDIPSFKARGVNARDFGYQLERIDSEFARWGTSPPEIQDAVSSSAVGWPLVKFHPSFSMTTALQALQRDDWKQAGAVKFNVELTQSASPAAKREGIYYDNGIYRSEPLWFGNGSGIRAGQLDVASKPYEKRFGMEDPWSEESRTEFGITPDGYVGEEFRDLLMKTEEL